MRRMSVNRRAPRKAAPSAAADHRFPFSVPAEGQLPGRLAAVLAVVYLIFNESYADPDRTGLAAEAIRLGLARTDPERRYLERRIAGT
jgi:predicted RNA polymerase sigma factor